MVEPVIWFLQVGYSGRVGRIRRFYRFKICFNRMV